MRKSTRKPAEERFWAKVDKTETCWNWTGAKQEWGHGVFRVRDEADTRWVLAKAYRFSYELVNGQIPEGMVLDHMCHNPPCVNPEHLRVVTPKQNNENRRGPNRNNPTGLRGAHKVGSRWRASIGRNGKTINLGMYDSAEEAAQVALEARLAEFTHNDVDRAA